MEQHQQGDRQTNKQIETKSKQNMSYCDWDIAYTQRCALSQINGHSSCPDKRATKRLYVFRLKLANKYV